MRAIIYFVSSMLFLLMGWHHGLPHALSVSPHPQSKHKTSSVSPAAHADSAKKFQLMWAKRVGNDKIALPIWAITLQREPGMEHHPTPLYAITLRSNGTAIYVAAAFAKRSGTYKALIPTSKFLQIVQLIEKSGFAHFEQFYGPSLTDIPQVTVVVAGRRTRKTVFVQGNDAFAPKALQKMERLIVAAVVNAKWTKVSDDTRLPLPL